MTDKHNTLNMIVGRFNPLTKYHKELIETNDIRFVYMTWSEDNDRNPIPAPRKQIITEFSLAGDRIVILCKDLFQALEHASNHIKGPRRIRLHCGSDRQADYQRLNTYTEQLGVKKLIVTSYPRMDDDHSATRLRELARQGDFAKFSELCGYHSCYHQEVYDMLRRTYGCV